MSQATQSATVNSLADRACETPAGAYKPLRVLIANGWSSCHGGSSTSLIDIVTHLDRSRFDPLVLCPEPGDLPDRLKEIGIPVVIRRNTRLGKAEVFQFARDVAGLVRLLRRENVALVHANVGGSRSALAMAAKLCGIPYIQHVRNGIRDGAWRTFAYRWARRVITNSDATGAPIRQDAEFREKTVTVYNAVDLSQYDGDDDRRAEIGSEVRPVIGTVGQIVSRKGVLTTIEAFRLVLEDFNDALLVIVGCAPPDEGDYEKECRSLVESLGLETQVVFTGYRRDVAAWMRTFDVFVLPTRKEPFGKVVVEAMAAGCPVVATRVGGIPEIITGPELGTLVPPDEPELTASAIKEYLRDHERAQQVGERGARSVRERFGVEGIVRQIEAVYDDVCN